MYKKLRQILEPLSKTPLHPQWFTLSHHQKLLQLINLIGENKTVLDIGCFDKWPRKHISTTSQYIGLDYYETASDWYHTVPDIYGDALHLPLKDQSFDAVLLLDVLEHISDTNLLFHEISRILKPGGILIIQTPFLYPLHDEPRDFIRPSIHWYKELDRSHNFLLEDCDVIGHPLETSALLANIAASKTVLGWIKAKNPFLIFILLLPIFIVTNNLMAKVFTLISQKDDFMPHTNQIVLRKAT